MIIKSKNTYNKIMINILIALLPIIIFTVYLNGITALIHILSGTLISFIIEFIYSKINKENNFFHLTGMFVSLLLPLNIPIYGIIIACTIASIVKIITSRFDKNIVNASLVGYIIVVFIFGLFNEINLGEPSLNEILFSKATLTISLYNGFSANSLINVGSVAIFISLLYLIITKTIKIRIVVSYVASFFIIMLIASRVETPYLLLQVFNSSLLFGALFIATEPTNSAVTPLGQILQGLFLGVLTVIFGMFFENGIVFSALICSILVAFFDYLGALGRFRKKTIIISISSMMFLIITTGIVYIFN